MKKNNKKKILNNLDFIISPSYNNSLYLLLKDNPDGLSDKDICKVLQISQKKLQKVYKQAIIIIRNKIKD